MLTACGSVRPVAPADLVGGGPSATRVTVRVTKPIDVGAPFSTVYVLPIGEYRPVLADDKGVYFASPTGVVERSGDEEKTLPGGLHLPNAHVRYYSFASFYVEFSPGDPTKLPLDDETRARYGDSVVFTVDGKEMRP